MASTLSSKSLTFLHSKNTNNNNHFSFPSKTFPFSFNNSLHFHKPLPLLSSSSPSGSGFEIIRVSTASLEYAPPAPDSNFHQEISRLNALRSKLVDCKSLEHKLLVLDSDSRVIRFFNLHKNGVFRALASLNLGSRELFLVKCLVAAGLEHVLNLGIGVLENEIESARSAVKTAFYALVEMIERFDYGENVKNGVRLSEEEMKNFRELMKTLEEIEHFYDCIGGIIGYQIMVLEHLAESNDEKQTGNWSAHIQESMECQFFEIHAPNVIDLSKNTEYASQAAMWGIDT